MSEVQYARYKNIIIFATDWRKYKIPDKQLDETNFRNEMQTEQFVRLDCLDVKQQREVLIYLFDKESKYTSSSPDLKRLLKKIKKPCDVILITYKPFSTYGKKAINTFKHINVMTYRHEIFDLVLPNGPLCYPHRVMARDEVLRLCNDELFCYLTNLPKIFNEDPMCIWNGARSGDVVEIKILSDISGEVIQYRVVVPKSGRVIFSKDTPEDADEQAKTAEVDPDADEADDEVNEHRELNVVEDDDDDADEEVQDHDADDSD